ncbi:unnamed protein product [Ilex paraguariensis]|uniref:Uncharacterized protein n=1 Tax=Ilex paraguariensis TaxID=185542 RepID=A0ABC8SIP8_9AQUA
MDSIVSFVLSENPLGGSIPKTLGKLSGLQVLELVGNELSGKIPIELGNATELTTILVSRNKLIGSIPEEVLNLKNLQVFDVSFNQLSGKIPPHKAVIPVSAFMNNPGLCGAPLPPSNFACSSACLQRKGQRLSLPNSQTQSDSVDFKAQRIHWDASPMHTNAELTTTINNTGLGSNSSCNTRYVVKSDPTRWNSTAQSAVMVCNSWPPTSSQAVMQSIGQTFLSPTRMEYCIASWIIGGSLIETAVSKALFTELAFSTI